VPRAGLTPDLVVDQAAALADEHGPQQLTLAAVAKSFGVALPSLYKHVSGLDDLHARLAVRAAGELATALRRGATGRSGSDALRGVSVAYRDYATRHPGRYPYLTRARPDDPAFVAAADDVIDVLRAVFRGYGIGEGDVVDAARFVRSTLHGFVALEGAGGFGLPDSVDASFDALVEAMDRALRCWSPTAG
jgi:AcrR family transcriptional regulator